MPPNDTIPTRKLIAMGGLRRHLDLSTSDLTTGTVLAPPSLDEAAFHPNAELHDNGALATIRIELPGVDARDVEITVTGNTIEISGEKRSVAEIREGDHYGSERNFGKFYRAFALPFSIDASVTEAVFDKGVLAIRIPVSQERTLSARKIAIQGP